ncbi:hypothetical protein MUK42_13904 [Musa troglodytarum]|uniref:Uncharacterized protein n=1 Tax=Musa troglodytarum TaxID=320322 RepID=A0A9E7HE37_9LILI|nr:hypothetical protein MUK42_13904 [Musa troglodytarum]
MLFIPANNGAPDNVYRENIPVGLWKCGIGSLPKHLADAKILCCGALTLQNDTSCFPSICHVP